MRALTERYTDVLKAAGWRRTRYDRDCPSGEISEAWSNERAEHLSVRIGHELETGVMALRLDVRTSILRHLQITQRSETEHVRRAWTFYERHTDDQIREWLEGWRAQIDGYFEIDLDRAIKLIDRDLPISCLIKEYAGRHKLIDQVITQWVEDGHRFLIGTLYPQGRSGTVHLNHTPYPLHEPFEVDACAAHGLLTAYLEVDLIEEVMPAKRRRGREKAEPKTLEQRHDEWRVKSKKPCKIEFEVKAQPAPSGPQFSPFFGACGFFDHGTEEKPDEDLEVKSDHPQTGMSTPLKITISEPHSGKPFIIVDSRDEHLTMKQVSEIANRWRESHDIEEGTYPRTSYIDAEGYYIQYKEEDTHDDIDPQDPSDRLSIGIKAIEDQIPPPIHIFNYGFSTPEDIQEAIEKAHRREIERLSMRISVMDDAEDDDELDDDITEEPEEVTEPLTKYEKRMAAHKAKLKAKRERRERRRKHGLIYGEE